MARRAPTPRAAFWRAICTGTPVDSAAAPSSHSAVICAEAKASCKIRRANHNTSSFGGEIKRLKLPRRAQPVFSTSCPRGTGRYDARRRSQTTLNETSMLPPLRSDFCFPSQEDAVHVDVAQGKSSPATRSVFILLLT